MVSYPYWDHGYPVSLPSSAKGPIVSSATYDELGKLTSLGLGNGLTTSYQYWGVEYRPAGSENSHYGLLRSVATGSLQSLTYGYDAKGNVSSLTDGRNGNETISFGYDHLDRLTSAMGPYAAGYLVLLGRDT